MLSTKGMALERLREYVCETRLERARLRDLMNELGRYYEDGEALVEAYKIEFKTAATTVDYMRDGKLSYSDVLTIGPTTPRPKAPRLLYSFRPNKTNLN